ncbi:hypothetical protein [Candidatus Halobonum tyrrellensis]|uniref:Uncharacterized protein n=1 Tax=Candidatus Halobonum tyrrellensis G22 TaxID=1324957 RepID=V4HAR5_9EURY|nr:hypothetical protein [Candidatus Halobonum tyrrellensis]ESP87153.1 hypothetical protein K933_15530 [Candidatus Halobonum tyrrellensis G22]
MFDFTLLDVRVHDNTVDFDLRCARPERGRGRPTTADAEGAERTDQVERTDADAADSSGGVGRALLTAATLAVVSAVAATVVARLFSDDDVSELADLDAAEGRGGDDAHDRV